MLDLYGFHVGKYTSWMDAMGRRCRSMISSVFINYLGTPLDFTHKKLLIIVITAIFLEI